MLPAPSFLSESARTVLIHVAPGMPPDYWWMTAAILTILALTATIDAFTTVIPDGLILLGIVAAAGTQGLYASWPTALEHLRQGVEAGLLIWLTNFLWYTRFGHDALGMGDAKWTALCVACFGAKAGGLAWGIGACLAVLWIGLARLGRYKVTQVTFGPFLFIGLIAGLYALRIYGTLVIPSRQ